MNCDNKNKMNNGIKMKCYQTIYNDIKYTNMNTSNIHPSVEKHPFRRKNCAPDYNPHTTIEINERKEDPIWYDPFALQQILEDYRHMTNNIIQ